jgi:hypothetical protein
LNLKKLVPLFICQVLFIIIKVQRLPRYVILIEAILKVSDKDDEYKKLDESLKKIKIIAEKVDQRVQDELNNSKKLHIIDETFGLEEIDILYSSSKY